MDDKTSGSVATRRETKEPFPRRCRRLEAISRSLQRGDPIPEERASRSHWRRPLSPSYATMTQPSVTLLDSAEAKPSVLDFILGIVLVYHGFIATTERSIARSATCGERYRENSTTIRSIIIRRRRMARKRIRVLHTYVGRSRARARACACACACGRTRTHRGPRSRRRRLRAAGLARLRVGSSDAGGRGFTVTSSWRNLGSPPARRGAAVRFSFLLSFLFTSSLFSSLLSLLLSPFLSSLPFLPPPLLSLSFSLFASRTSTPTRNTYTSASPPPPSSLPSPPPSPPPLLSH